MVIRRTAQWREGPNDRLRMLIEDPGAGWFDEFARYRSAGIEVAVCTGPEDAAQPCPHLHGRACDLWNEADAIVFALPRDQPAARLVLKTGRRAHPGKPILFEPTMAANSGDQASRAASAASRISAILSGHGASRD